MKEVFEPGVLQRLKIDPAILARFMTGGLLTGVGSASLLNYVRSLRDLKERRKQLSRKVDTDEDTIVLTLPAKSAAVVSKFPTAIKRVDIPRQTSMPSAKHQTRHTTGKYGVKTAAYNWQTLVAGTVGAVGSGALGVHAVNKVYQRIREKQLSNELRAAQQEYLRMITHEKDAEWLDCWFPPLVKSAQAHGNFGILHPAAATIVLMLLAGAGGSAYLTKKILDEKFKQTQQQTTQLPKLKRVVIKTLPATRTEKPPEDEEMVATAEDISCVKSAISVMMDTMDSGPKILDDPQVKSAMVKYGATKAELVKLAQDADFLIDYLKNKPELRLKLQQAAMNKHPILKRFKWALKVPGISHYADRKLYSKVQDFINPQVKSAQIPGLLASVVGSTIAEQQGQQELLRNLITAQQRLHEEQEAAKSPSKKNLRDTVAGVSLDAMDPAAQAFLAKNREKILQTLHHLASAGKL